MDHSILTAQVLGFAEAEPWYVPLFANVSALLYETMPDLNWAGFYLLRDGRLVLGPFHGRPACIHIQMGKGVCGTAAAEDRTVIVPDVHRFPGHIACDSASMSEIVIPIHAGGAVVAVLDVDSPVADRFGKEERLSLEAVVRVLEEKTVFTNPEPVCRNAYFAGGCFWCITPVFAELPGVSRVLSGYSGGREVRPSYEDVKGRRTHHRETVRITYDPNETSFEQLLDVFLQNVDPFDAEGQFIDRGASYTLAVYYTSPAEKRAAERRLAALELSSGSAPAVSVEPFAAFYEAEEEHQDYYLKNPEAFAAEMDASGRNARFNAARRTSGEDPET